MGWSQQSWVENHVASHAHLPAAGYHEVFTISILFWSSKVLHSLPSFLSIPSCLLLIAYHNSPNCNACGPTDIPPQMGQRALNTLFVEPRPESRALGHRVPVARTVVLPVVAVPFGSSCHFNIRNRIKST